MSWNIQQTEHWQDTIFAVASAKNDLDSLCWFIQCIRPLSKRDRRKMNQQQIIDAVYKTACWPGNWVPFLPVGENPEVSREWAKMLANMFAASNPASWRFMPAICLRSELSQSPVRCYEFGETWDCVCAICGCVFPACVTADICEDCAK